MERSTADRFLGLLQSFHLDRLTAEEREYFLGALTDEERVIVSARLGLGAESRWCLPVFCCLRVHLSYPLL